MKTIPLSQGKSALVDDEDFERLSQFRWRYFSKGRNEYAHCHSPMIQGKRSTLLMHRIVMRAVNGQEIDHRDNNGLNNQKSNLRFCNRSQNNGNMRVDPKSKTGFKGVRFIGNQPLNPWRAQLGFRGTLIDLGSHPTAIAAAEAYNRAALKYFGEYAKVNKI